MVSKKQLALVFVILGALIAGAVWMSRIPPDPEPTLVLGVSCGTSPTNNSSITYECSIFTNIYPELGSLEQGRIVFLDEDKNRLGYIPVGTIIVDNKTGDYTATIDERATYIRPEFTQINNRTRYRISGLRLENGSYVKYTVDSENLTYSNTTVED